MTTLTTLADLYDHESASTFSLSDLALWGLVFIAVLAIATVVIAVVRNEAGAFTTKVALGFFGLLALILVGLWVKL